MPQTAPVPILSSPTGAHDRGHHVIEGSNPNNSRLGLERLRRRRPSHRPTRRGHTCHVPSCQSCIHVASFHAIWCAVLHASCQKGALAIASPFLTVLCLLPASLLHSPITFSPILTSYPNRRPGSNALSQSFVQCLRSLPLMHACQSISQCGSPDELSGPPGPW